ncbi:MAG: carbohydrate ABC transporter permease [Clostridiales bacterium]|nr:carbohydrate ABC transporter permease [Clostridiales bacterium]MDY4199678.1 carbohydrate ABC transporter permease [Candidatus Fimadaptatus sp.]
MSKQVGRKPSSYIADAIIVIIMLALMFITVYPLLYTVFASFSDAKQLLKLEGPMWWPLEPFTLRGYELTFQNAKLVPSIFNTLFYVIVGTLGGLVITGMAAFVLSRKNFMLKNIIMKLIMFTMFFSGGIIPLFFVVRQIGIYDTRWAFLLPWIMSAYNMIIMRTFFLGIPESLEESATLDGATDLQIFFKIYVPLSTAVIAVIAMYYGVAWWNSWYQSLVFQPSNSLWPLQMILREVLITNTKSATTDVTSMAEESYTRELVKYCTVVVSTVPILIIYPFLQRYFVKGVMIGAVKG